MLITTNSPRSEYAALKAAGDLGIPSLCLVDLFALQEINWLKTPGLGTKVCVLNKAVRDMFVREGRPEDEIAITGNPAFDAIYDPAVIQAGSDLRQARGWGKGRFTILYATSTEPERHPFTGEVGDHNLPSLIEERLRDILKDRPDLELVVRRHPNEVQEVKPGERIYSSGPTEDICMLIHAVDIVLVTSSTVGAQAYLAGVPLISIESSIMSKDTPYADFGMARSAQSLEDLEEVLLDEIACLKTVQTNKVTVQRCEYASATSLACDQAIEMLSSSTCSGS
jgi:UDP-N-acetylglucosamine 2-epimerase